MYVGITLPYIYSRTSSLFCAHVKYMHVIYQSRRKEAHKNWNVCVISFHTLTPEDISASYTLYYSWDVIADNFVNLRGLEPFIRTILGNSSERRFPNIEKKTLQTCNVKLRFYCSITNSLNFAYFSFNYILGIWKCMEQWARFVIEQRTRDIIGILIAVFPGRETHENVATARFVPSTSHVIGRR